MWKDKGKMHWDAKDINSALDSIYKDFDQREKERRLGSYNPEKCSSGVNYDEKQTD